MQAGGLAGMLRQLRDEGQALAHAGLKRRLEPPCGVDFASNDYLGFAASGELLRRVRLRAESAIQLREAATAPASRLLRGHLPLHQHVEQRLARFKGTEGALLFASGYQANLALLTTVLRAQDRVISDRLNHASLIDAVRLARCHKVIVPHLDLRATEEALRQPWPGQAQAGATSEGRTLIVTESLFSMDGDHAPLAELVNLADCYGAAVVVDDAHATGLFGQQRASGLLEDAELTHRVLAITSTGGKALGVGGGFIAGHGDLIELMVQRARPFVFSTAVPPLMLWALEAALDMLEEMPDRGTRALRLARGLRARLRQQGWQVPGTEGPIVPVIVGGNDEALRIADAVQARGYDVRAVRPPTVPPGTARLRISVHADRSDEEIEGLAAAMADLLPQQTDREAKLVEEIRG